MTCRLHPDRRKADLARIHILKAELALDDATYRDTLFTLARVRSAKDLDASGRAAVVDHLQALVDKAKRRQEYPGRPHNIESGERGPMLRKIEALLTDARRPWAYAQGMARRMFHVDQLEFCSPDQLHKLVAALVIDARRRASKAAS